MSSTVLNSVPAAGTAIQLKPSLPWARAIALSVVLALASSLLYLPIVHHPFANIDDQGYIYENLHVQEGLTWPTIKWAFTTLDDDNWHPLTWLSIALDCQMFGIDPAGHHAMNIVYHAIDGVVLFWVLMLATDWVGRSFMVAALFALHPINVESVAWAAERKTVLSMLFFLLALGSYRWYARRPNIARYSVVATLFALGLMTKPQIITLPCVLLLWDYWPLRRMAFGSSRVVPRIATDGMSGAPAENDRLPPLPSRSIRWLLLEKIPLFILCALSALATIKAQHVAHVQSWQYSTWIRVANSIVAYVRYLGKAIWPSKLAILYPHPGDSLPLWQVAVCALLLMTITALVVAMHRYRYLPVRWFWFLGTLVPTIGLIQVGRQAMADRYAYQSFLGLFIMACWGLADWARRIRLPTATLPAFSIVLLSVLMVATHRQIDVWRNNLTLWSHTLEVTRNNWEAEDMIAEILFQQGRRDEAVALFRAASNAHPGDEASNLALAIYEQQRGNLPEAVRRYKVAINAMDAPLEQAKVYQNLAAAYRDLGDTANSVECLRRSQQLRKP